MAGYYHSLYHYFQKERRTYKASTIHIQTLLEKFQADWLSDNTVANNARVGLKFADNAPMLIDDILGRSAITTPVNVAVAASGTPRK